jgi:transcriptional regulator of acetoin/glycerol metabolism
VDPLSAGDGDGTDGQTEAQRIENQLQRFGGHRAKTARALGMDRTTLWRKMKRYGIG